MKVNKLGPANVKQTMSSRKMANAGFNFAPIGSFYSILCSMHIGGNYAVQVDAAAISGYRSRVGNLH